MSTGITPPEKPGLRHLEIIPVSERGEEFYLFRDRHGFSEDAALPQAFGPLLRLLDGKRTRAQIISEYALQSGETLPADFLDKLLARLDEQLLLDSPRFAAEKRLRLADYAGQKERQPGLAGSAYPDAPNKLRAQLDRLYVRAATLNPTPAEPCDRNTGRLRGCIVPHIDFARGGAVEALSYLPLLKERFDVLVILGIAHGGLHYPFCMDTRDFRTPLGTCKYDHEFGIALRARLGDKLTAEQWSHKSEHSVEFVTVFLQHAEELKQARIVPIICGGFFEEIQTGASPSDNPEIAAFCAALREVTRDFENRGQRVGFIVSVDGAHVGSQFGDDTPLTPERLRRIECDDLEFWRTVQCGDMEAMHAHISRDNNERNVDAHPAVYALFSAFPELRARMQRYEQAYSKEQNIVVSFAALTLIE